LPEGNGNTEKAPDASEAFIYSLSLIAALQTVIGVYLH
jgi:hypothetical protein